MTGVDYLIERGIVHPDRMGIMGWSAGGEFSNWALVSTDRFKAISTGAGTVTSYDWDYDFDSESPLKYIKNAKTPTLIHFGEDDPMMPRRHGEILHMALKKLGVPTEFIVYPNTGHGIRNMRYQMVKMQAEFSWFEKWIRGKKGWIDWKDMIETLKMEEK
jgi:dipeptidyl aminopeptidase/acylaminoacyl peptidase